MKTPPPCCGESDTLELRITVGKSILFYYTIYILCRVEACDGGNREEGDDQQGDSEASSADIPSVLGVDLTFVNQILAERGWLPVNASHPSLCGTPPPRIAWHTRGQKRLSSGSGAEAIR